MMYIVVWPDGTKTKAESPTQLLIQIAAAQWPKPDGSTYTVEEIKADLSKRAQVISNKFIHPAQPDESFIREIHRVGLWVLVMGQGVG